MKKTTIITLSILLAGASAFAWSKKSENLGNLGRTYISISGAVNVAKYKSAGATGTGETSSPTGAQGSAVINAPILKPGINAFRDVKWAGLDGSIFFNYTYTGDIDFNAASRNFSNYNIGGQLTPYLNFETGLPFLKAVKPFGFGYAGYEWMDYDDDIGGSGNENDDDIGGIGNENYFIYGVGAGVELVLLDEISITPYWKWNANAQDDMPCYHEAGIEASYWVTDQFCVSVFWTHDFGWKMDEDSGFRMDKKHGDIIGAKFKIGFLR